MASVNVSERIFVRTIQYPQKDFEEYHLVFCQVIRNPKRWRQLEKGDIILMHKVNCFYLRIMHPFKPYTISFNRGDCNAWIKPAQIIGKIAEANCLEIIQKLNSQM